MSYINIEMDGLKELIEAYEKLPDQIIEELKTGLMQPANKVIGKARQNLLSNKSVKDADLYNSLKINKPKRHRKYKYSCFASVYFGKGGYHGVPVELGHRLFSHGKLVGDVDAKPFLRPAFDESTDDMENSMKDSFNRAVDKMGGKK